MAKIHVFLVFDVVDSGYLGGRDIIFPKNFSLCIPQTEATPWHKSERQPAIVFSLILFWYRRKRLAKRYFSQSHCNLGLIYSHHRYFWKGPFEVSFIITLLHSTVFFHSLIFMVMPKGCDECQMYVTLQLFIPLKLKVPSRGNQTVKRKLHL